MMIEIGNNLRHMIEYGITTFCILLIADSILEWSKAYMDYKKKEEKTNE